MRVEHPVNRYYWSVLAGSAALVAFAVAFGLTILDAGVDTRFLVLAPVALLLAALFLHREEGRDIRSHMGGTGSLLAITAAKLGLVFVFALGLVYAVVLVGTVLVFPLG